MVYTHNDLFSRDYSSKGFVEVQRSVVENEAFILFLTVEVYIQPQSFL